MGNHDSYSDYLGVLDPLIDFFRWMLLMLIRLFLP